MARIAELEAERDAHLGTLDDRNKLLIKFQELQLENALLRKTLEDAPHMSMCDSWDQKPCDCWKSRIQEAKPPHE